MVRRYPLKERRRSSAMPDNSETMWEYHVQGVNGLAGKLSGLGEERWELVGFYETEAFFKRRKASKDSLQSIFEE